MLLLTKQDRWSQSAAAIARALFPGDVDVIEGRVGTPLPEEALWYRDGPIVSFLSPWVLPAAILCRVPLAINFHCGSAAYPGIGSYNFALYEGASVFGAICHHMTATVDSGPIIEERRFPIFPCDTVETLKLRTMAVMLGQCHDVLCRLKQGDELVPREDLRWERRPFTRRALNALTEIRPEMDAEEVARRVRATTYPGYGGPVVTIGGVAFRADVPDRAPLA